MTLDEIIAQLRAQANPKNVAGMARFGINPAGTLGVSVTALKKIARQARRDHPLALALWETGIHEARILAALVDDPAQVDAAQMDRWAAGFDSWDVCDEVCLHLFVYTAPAMDKAVEWAHRPEEFVRRAGFALMASLAVHAKTTPDEVFTGFLPLVQEAAVDERNYVRKAVNWALRQIGKRNPALRAQALAVAETLCQSPSRSARWVGSDARRELLTR